MVYSFQTLIHHYQTTHCHNSKRPQYKCFNFVHQWTSPMCYYQDHLALWQFCFAFILNQLNSVQTSAAYFSSTHSALILLSPCFPSKWLFRKRNPLWNPLQISFLSSLWMHPDMFILNTVTTVYEVCCADVLACDMNTKTRKHPKFCWRNL